MRCIAATPSEALLATITGTCRARVRNASIVPLESAVVPTKRGAERRSEAAKAILDPSSLEKSITKSPAFGSASPRSIRAATRHDACASIASITARPMRPCAPTITTCARSVGLFKVMEWVGGSTCGLFWWSPFTSRADEGTTTDGVAYRHAATPLSDIRVTHRGAIQWPRRRRLRRRRRPRRSPADFVSRIEQSHRSRSKRPAPMVLGLMRAEGLRYDRGSFPRKAHGPRHR